MKRKMKERLLAGEVLVGGQLRFGSPANMSSPATVTSPPTLVRREVGGRPSNVAPRTLLPEPDSPTKATISPRLRSRSTPRSASIVPSATSN